MLQKRFEGSEISLPEGFFYWPIDMGGLELRNPLVPLLCMRESMRRSPEHVLAEALKADEEEYLDAKERYKLLNTGFGLGGRFGPLSGREVRDKDDFMPKEEFMRYREVYSRRLYDAYQELLSVPTAASLERTGEIAVLLETLPHGTENTTIKPRWFDMDSYWKWMVALYGPEIKEKHGGLQMADPAQIPLGIVKLLKEGRVRWR